MNILFRKTGSLFFSVLLILSISGCVSSEKHETLESQYNICQHELSEARKTADTLFQEKANLIQEKDNLIQEKGKLEQVKNQMIEDLEAEISEKSVQIQMLEEKLRVTAVEKLFFDSGSADVKQQGRAILAKIAGTLKAAENMEIHIIGHSDELPPGEKISKKFPSNWELSTARATSIIHILQWGYGIDPKRMVAEGVAHYRPLVMETAENRAMNRVVEFSLTVMPGTK
ncbi:MAG: OmpA family protein [Pseudomonadota bacterium]